MIISSIVSRRRRDWHVLWLEPHWTAVVLSKTETDALSLGNRLVFEDFSSMTNSLMIM